MHPALIRLIRVLAECEAERLCAEKEAGPACEAEPEDGDELMKPITTFREESVNEQAR